jgi:hypothetical protein
MGVAPTLSLTPDLYKARLLNLKPRNAIQQLLITSVCDGTLIEAVESRIRGISPDISKKIRSSTGTIQL